MGCALLYNNLAPFQRHCRFLCSWRHPYSTLILGAFPLHQIAHMGSAQAADLSYSAVKLFLKYSNLCDHGTWKLQTDTTFRPFKVIDFGTNRQRICDFLLVRHNWSYLAPFRIYCRFLCSWVTPPLFHPNFWGVPVASAHPCWCHCPNRSLTLFGREIIFEVFQPMITVPERYRQTDRQTTYCGIISHQHQSAVLMI